MGFRDLKCRNGAQNWNLREKLSKTGPVENFWLWSKSTVNGQGQRSTADVAVWCHLGLTWQEERAAASTCGAWVRVTGACGRVRRVAGTSGAWRRVQARGSACSWGRNFRRRVEARVMQFLAVLGWVLLGIGCSVFLCLFFGSWMSRTLIFESCRYCGRDGGGSLLTVITGWRRGQRKNIGDVHRN